MAETGAEIGWWGQRWLTHAIGCLPAAPTEAQLKSAAREQPHFAVEKGRVEARVGTATAVLRVKPLPDRDWRRVLEAAGADRELATRLLTGQFGAEVDELFTRTGLQLFPPATLRCSCKKAGCRHVHALMLGAVELLDENPYLWLEVLGRPRTELLAALQARVADTRTSDAETPDDALDPDRFWATDEDPDEIPVNPGDSEAAPDALLRLLGPLPLPEETAWVEMVVAKTVGRGEDARPVLTRMARPLDEVLREYVSYIGEATRAFTTGVMPPQYAAEPLPGKPVPLAARLAPEVEEALRQEGALLSADQLAARCPTAAALPATLGKNAVTDAFALLPPDLTVLARRYAGLRSAALEGRAFRHIITFAEWRRGAFTADADWLLALSAAGANVRLPDGLWERLRPEVGDELWLTVVDTAGPYLQAELLPRRGRRPGLDPGAVPAVRALLKHLAETSQWGIAEQEAVAVLLAEGHYDHREQQDELWLLPFQVNGIVPGPGRSFQREQQPWRPEFGRPLTHQWSGLADALRWYAADLEGAGLSRPRAEMALRCVRWWCGAAWPGAQDRPGALPPVGTLLEFLWVTAPRQADKHDVAPEEVPAFLGRWFRVLETHYVGMDGLYAPHIQACARAELSEHRLQTLPDLGSPEAEILGWVTEGYRWIGAAELWAGMAALSRRSPLG